MNAVAQRSAEPCQRCEGEGELYTQSPCNEASWTPLSEWVARNQSGWSLPCPDCRGRGVVIERS